MVVILLWSTTPSAYSHHCYEVLRQRPTNDTGMCYRHISHDHLSHNILFCFYEMIASLFMLQMVVILLWSTTPSAFSNHSCEVPWQHPTNGMCYHHRHHRHHRHHHIPYPTPSSLSQSSFLFS